MPTLAFVLLKAMNVSFLRIVRASRREITSFLAAAAICCCLAAFAQACPTCKDGVAENDPAGKAMVAGYFYSILFMMSAPYLIFGTFVACVYRTVKRVKQSRPAAEDSADAAGK